MHMTSIKSNATAIVAPHGRSGIVDSLAKIGPIVSVSGRVRVPSVFVLALGSETSRVGPLILTRTVARELCSLLERSGLLGASALQSGPRRTVKLVARPTSVLIWQAWTACGPRVHTLP
jgi:hypothetical protein